MPSREEAIQQDVKDLHGLGYAQELFRTMGGFSNFAISFSIISILTGAVILYDYGLAWAGKAAVTLGWPLITIFVLAIAASMAELASAYPTAGGLYYWASKMKNKNWGWWTAWLNLIGQFAIVAGINYAAAGFINATIIDRLVGGTFNTVEVIPGVLNGQLVTMGVLMLIQLAMNIAGINLVALLNQVSVWWHIAIVAIVARGPHALRQAGHLRPRSSSRSQPLDTAGSWNNDLGPISLVYGPAVSYPIIAGLLLLAAPGQLDVHRLRRLGARGRGDDRRPGRERLGRVPFRRRVGGRRLHLPDGPDARTRRTCRRCSPRRSIDPATYSQYYFGGGVAVISILTYNLGELLRQPVERRDRDRDGVLRPLVRGGRRPDAVRVLARRRAARVAGWLKKVSKRYRTPANSLTAIVVVSWLFTVAAFFVGTGLGHRHRDGDQHDLPVRRVRRRHLPRRDDREWMDHRAWSLGRWSKPIAWVAVSWVHRADGPVQLPDERQHLVAVHGHHGPAARSSTTSGGRRRASRAPRCRAAPSSSPRSRRSSSRPPGEIANA